MFEEKKLLQKEIIEKLATPTKYTKLELINILDEQISNLPYLDKVRYVILLKSAEHPNGFALGMEARPVLRLKKYSDNDIRIVRDTSNNVDSYFWDKPVYDKMCSKAIDRYMIGTQTGLYLEYYAKIRSAMNEEEGALLSSKVAASKNPFEVIITPADERVGVLVTQEIVDALGGKLLESYNDKDENDLSPLCINDLLIQDGEDGFYYRVEASLAISTYAGPGIK